jgi:DNA-binding NarL/FixJ family response regulator
MTNNNTFQYIRQEIHFTDQQSRVLHYLAQGMNHRDIAQELQVNPFTLRQNALKSIRNKTGLREIKDIVEYANKNGYGNVEEGRTA